MEPATARLFDAMADDYDTLEPWYEHLYAVLHRILREVFGPVHGRPRRRALDAGCGTGFQTAILAALGYETHGVDIAARLLAAARRRAPAAGLARASIEALPYRDGDFDAAACCGSTLSFVDDPAAALRELGRVLKPGGSLLLECEHRPSLDLGWALVSALGGDALGYGLSPAVAWRQLIRRPRDGDTVTYPGYGRLRLFARREVTAMLLGAELEPIRWWGIHSVTNLIPSTVLHRDRLGPVTATLYARLRTIDARLAASPLASRTANSLVVLAEKRSAANARDRLLE